MFPPGACRGKGRSGGFDVLLSPTSPTTAFAFGDKTADPMSMYLNDVCTIATNLAGHPAMSVPFGVGDDGMPIGAQVLAPALGEVAMFRTAAALEAAAATWTGEWWHAGGGGTVWDAMAYDPELRLLYVGTGNGSPYPRWVRSPGGGDNLYLASILALRPDTGELVWHYQVNPAETWDYTATQPIMLVDLRIEGRLRRTLLQAPKNGFFYVLDRETGEFISAAPFVPVTWSAATFGPLPRT